MKEQGDMNARREYWGKSRRKWYNIYFFSGVGINFILYFTKPGGFDPSGNILLGSILGLGIPITTMVVFSYIHKKVIGL